MKNRSQGSCGSAQYIRANGHSPLFFLLFAMTVVLIFTACDRSGETAYKEGEKLWDDGKYVEALVRYENVVSNHPKGHLATDALYQIGNICLLNLRDYQKAVAAYRRLVETSPKSPFSPDAQKKIAEIYKDKFGDIKGAITEYQRFADLYPQEADKALVQMAQCYILLRDFEKAREKLKQILKDSSDIDYKDDIYYQIANSYYLEGDTVKARNGFEELLKMFPDSRFVPDARFGIALTYEEAGDLEEAITRFTQLEGIYPNQIVLQLRIAGIKERVEARKKPMPAKAPKIGRHHK